MWPVWLVRPDPLWGVIAPGPAFWLFPMTLNKPIEAWLFADEESRN